MKFMSKLFVIAAVITGFSGASFAEDKKQGQMSDADCAKVNLNAGGKAASGGVPQSSDAPKGGTEIKKAN